MVDFCIGGNVHHQSLNFLFIFYFLISRFDFQKILYLLTCVIYDTSYLKIVKCNSMVSKYTQTYAP